MDKKDLNNIFIHKSKKISMNIFINIFIINPFNFYHPIKC